MTDDDGEDTIINVRVPSSLNSQLKNTYQRRGFESKSEFVRTALRDALHPPEEVFEEALADIKASEEQVKQGKTTSLSEFTSKTESPPEGAYADSPVSDTANEGKLSDLKQIFSGSPDKSEMDLDVLVVGCGGAGNHIANRINEIRTGNIRTVAIDTDREHLNRIQADTKLLIGKTIHNGVGSGGDLDIGEKSARMGEGSIKKIISEVDIVFITAGLGGGTGTGASPVIAEFASETGAVVIGAVNTPFNIEQSRARKAEEGVKKLRSVCDTVIVFDSNRLRLYS